MLQKFSSLLAILILEAEARSPSSTAKSVKENNEDPDTKEEVEEFPWWIWFILGDILLIILVVTCCKWWICIRSKSKMNEDAYCDESGTVQDQRRRCRTDSVRSDVILIPQTNGPQIVN